MKINVKTIAKHIKANLGFLVFVLIMFASRSSLADWYHVPSGSMLPTIVEGDRVFVDKTAYQLQIPFTDINIVETGAPERGDIVVFFSPKDGTRLIKRLVGVPGDVIEMRNNRLILNGKSVDYHHQENQLIESLGKGHSIQVIPRLNGSGNFREVIVPDEHYLVLGDNRNNSVDSRYYGFVPRHLLQGKATTVVFSNDLESNFSFRTERTLKPLI
ncbi:MAG: signal peptidase I [Pseudomonadota bacterium]